jgi:hypothetical protein
VKNPTSKISNNNNIKSSKSSLPKKTLSSSSSSSSGLSTASTATTTQTTSVYTKLSSIKPSTIGCKSTNSTQPNGHQHLKENPTNVGKRVRTTFIGQIPTTNKPYTNGTNGHHHLAAAATTKKASTIPQPLIRTKY